jgi:integrase
MPRKYPQPFWRDSRACYFVQIGKKQVRLSPDKDEAFRLYHELMTRGSDEPPVAPPPAGDTQAVATVLDEFLDWISRHKAPRTYAWYRENIQRFLDGIPPTLTVAELKPFHVTQALDRFPNWGNNTQHDFIGAVKRAFNWALDEERIDRNPLARVKKPAREAREMAVSPAEYVTILEAVKDPSFRDLLELSWETGARVQELRKIEAQFLDLENNRIVFPPKQAKGKKYHRVIYLIPRAREILARLAHASPMGPIVLNSDGSPWTKDAINCAFCRLQLALGRKAIEKKGLATKSPARLKTSTMDPETIPAARAARLAVVRNWQKETTKLARELGPKYHLGAFRKGFATQALKAGVDTVTVAHLLGHRDPSMISKVYGQVQNDPEHMANAAKRAKGG